MTVARSTFIRWKGRRGKGRARRGRVRGSIYNKAGAAIFTNRREEGENQGVVKEKREKRKRKEGRKKGKVRERKKEEEKKENI